MFIGVLFRREYLLAASRHKLVSLIAQKMFRAHGNQFGANRRVHGPDNFQSRIMGIIDWVMFSSFWYLMSLVSGLICPVFFSWGCLLKLENDSPVPRSDTFNYSG